MIEKKIEKFLSSYLEKKKIKNTNWNITKNVKKGFGDYSSNIALVLGKISKTSPIKLSWALSVTKKVMAKKSGLIQRSFIA
jgi:arginyl-tRNA synthetase